MFHRLQRSLGVRGILIFCSCLCAILVAMTVMNVAYQRRVLENLANDYVTKLGKLMLTAMSHPMLTGDQDVIQKQFDLYATIPGVEVAHLTDKTGMIRRSTDKRLINQKPLSPYLADALAGKEYHGLELRQRTKRVIITELVPIFNEPRCYPCHGSRDKVLGVVRLGMDWQSVIEAINATRNWNIVLSLVGLLVMSLLLTLFFFKIVIAPIKHLELGIKKVAQGDLDSVMEIKRNDEIGTVTAIFNTMTADLKRLMGERQRKTDAFESLNIELRDEITERIKAENALESSKQRFQNIIDFLPDTTFVIDLRPQVIAWNMAMEKMTGISAQDILGKGDHEYALPFYNERRPILVNLSLNQSLDIEKNYLSLVKDGTTVTAEVFAPALNNGKGAYLWAIATPLYDINGNIDGAIESVRDISLIKKTEEQLRHAYEELKQIQNQLVQTAKMASVGSLAGGVAHEINNPLTGVLNNVQLINLLAQEKQDFSMRDFKDLLNVIEDSAQRCVKITRSLLDFSHASKGAHQPVNLNETVNKVMSFIGHDLQLENVIIKTQLDPAVQEISADAQLMQQVIFDIISNARWAIKKKNPSLGGVISVSTEARPDTQEMTVAISDTGIGIKKENLDKIFEPFFTTKDVGEGTGLGLSIVYSIIKEHGGSIAVESEVGQGTSFRITFPAISREQAKAA